MKKTKTKDQKETPIPFDEAVKRLWKSPPQHIISEKKDKASKEETPLMLDFGES